MIATIPNWTDRAHAAQAVDAFSRLVDRYAEEVPADMLAVYREALDASSEEAQGEFLIAVAGQLNLRLAEAGPDAVTRAGALLAAWFLRPR
jgi:hypothetical protein